MSRIKLEVPKQFHFSTTITVRVTDLNYGGHMGNDALLSLMHEARYRFLQKWGYTEMNLEGANLIMADVGIQYKAEAFAGDELKFEMTAYDFSVTSFDLFYYITRVSDGKTVALGKTNMVCYSYEEKKMKEVPQKFIALFS
jgi:acyl-CoA thioesterase FadM